MGIFPKLFKKHKFIVGETYLLSDGKRIVEAKLIRSTERGFNFLNVSTNKNLFKKHLYPLEANRDTQEFTFQLLKDIVIEKKPANDGKNNNKT